MAEALSHRLGNALGEWSMLFDDGQFLTRDLTTRELSDAISVEPGFSFRGSIVGEQAMSADNTPENDPFAPPAVATEVRCLHCGETYESYLIRWEERETERGIRGFWVCPIPGCDGAGFGFDILPTDPNYRDENGGWVYFDDERESRPGPHRRWRGVVSKWWIDIFRATPLRRGMPQPGCQTRVRRDQRGNRNAVRWRYRR